MPSRVSLDIGTRKAGRYLGSDDNACLIPCQRCTGRGLRFGEAIEQVGQKMMATKGLWD
jgi:hypothetical protein